jgi:hypothetical protein
MSLPLKLLPGSVRLTAKYWDIKLNYVIVVLFVLFPFILLPSYIPMDLSVLPYMVIFAGFIKWFSSQIDLIIDVWKMNAIAFI